MPGPGVGVWAESVAQASRRANRIPYGGIRGGIAPCRGKRLPHQARRIFMLLLPQFHFLQPVGALEDFARLAAVRRTDDAIALHAIQNARGAPVAQAQMAL